MEKEQPQMPSPLACFGPDKEELSAKRTRWNQLKDQQRGPLPAAQ
jgi:hypothetical protein